LPHSSATTARTARRNDSAIASGSRRRVRGNAFTVENLPRARRRDADATAESVRRAVRAVINEQWGKKPICLVHVLTV
jgi:mRNA degradation ribonuclease J1/J2